MCNDLLTSVGNLRIHFLATYRTGRYNSLECKGIIRFQTIELKYILI